MVGRAFSEPRPSDSSGTRVAPNGIISVQFLLWGFRNACRFPSLNIIGMVIMKSASSTDALGKLVTSKFNAPNQP